MSRWADRIVSRTSGPVRGPANELNTFAVTAVHGGSIAAEAGVAAGWLYRPSRPTALSPLVLPERGAPGRVTSRFVDASAGAELELITNGFPFGLELAKSPAALANDVLGSAFDVDAVAALVHQGERDQIHELVQRVAKTMKARNRSLGDVLKGLLAKPPPSDQVALDLDPENYMGLVPHAKLVGAFWLAANRKPQGARRLLQAWEHWGIELSGGEWSALYYLTVALLKESEGAAGLEVRNLLGEAATRVERSALIDIFWRERSDDPVPARARWSGRTFPRNYRLAAYDPLTAGSAAGAPYLSLEEATAKLADDQRLIVYLLGGYRANGYYARSLHRLQQIYEAVRNVYPVVHVITSFEPGGRHNPEWLGAETLARRRGVDVRVLNDPGDTVMGVVRATRSPHAFILDRELNVYYDGMLTDETGFWSGLAPKPPVIDAAG
jgi:hypothetical protein